MLSSLLKDMDSYFNSSVPEREETLRLRRESGYCSDGSMLELDSNFEGSVKSEISSDSFSNDSFSPSWEKIPESFDFDFHFRKEHCPKDKTPRHSKEKEMESFSAFKVRVFCFFKIFDIKNKTIHSSDFFLHQYVTLSVIRLSKITSVMCL